jgi:hypothetical protein
MEILDLHGKKHHQVDEEIRRFLNFVELPCQIITGNSSTMKRMTKDIVKEYGWLCRERDSYNYGTLIIMEGKI